MRSWRQTSAVSSPRTVDFPAAQRKAPVPLSLVDSPARRREAHRQGLLRLGSNHNQIDAVTDEPKSEDETTDNDDLVCVGLAPRANSRQQLVALLGSEAGVQLQCNVGGSGENTEEEQS